MDQRFFLTEVSVNRDCLSEEMMSWNAASDFYRTSGGDTETDENDYQSESLYPIAHV